MMRIQKVVLAGFIAALGLVVYLVLDPQHRGTVDVVGSYKTSPSAQSDALHQMQAGIPKVPEGLRSAPVAAVTSRDTVSKAFYSARNYRTLYESLLQRGDEGGGYYALRILLLCSLVRTEQSTLATSANSRQQDASRQLLDERCSSFTTTELDNQLQTLHDPRLKNDPLERLSQQFMSELDDPVKRVVRAKEILDTEDPLLVQNMAHRLFRSNSTAVFDGVRFEQANAAYILAAAWQSASCSISEGCGIEDPTVLNACALQGYCFQDRETVLRNEVEREFGNDGAALFDSVQPRMREVIKAKDGSALRLQQ